MINGLYVLQVQFAGDGSLELQGFSRCRGMGQDAKGCGVSRKAPGYMQSFSLTISLQAECLHNQLMAFVPAHAILLQIVTLSRKC